MMTKNTLTQKREESLEQYIARIKSMTNEEIQNAAEAQRVDVLESYRKATKPSSYKRRVYHK